MRSKKKAAPNKKAAPKKKIAVKKKVAAKKKAVPKKKSATPKKKTIKSKKKAVPKKKAAPQRTATGTCDVYCQNCGRDVARALSQTAAVTARMAHKNQTGHQSVFINCSQNNFSQQGFPLI